MDRAESLRRHNDAVTAGCLGLGDKLGDGTIEPGRLAGKKSEPIGSGQRRRERDMLAVLHVGTR